MDRKQIRIVNNEDAAAAAAAAEAAKAAAAAKRSDGTQKVDNAAADAAAQEAAAKAAAKAVLATPAPGAVTIIDEQSGQPLVMDNAQIQAGNAGVALALIGRQNAGDEQRVVIPVQIGNAVTALATAPIQRLQSYVQGLPMQPIEQAAEFIFPRTGAGLLFDYESAPLANQLAVVDDDTVGYNGLPRVIVFDKGTTTTKRLIFRGVETPYDAGDQQIDAAVPGRSILNGEQYRARRLAYAIELGRLKRAIALVEASVLTEGTLDFSSDNDPIIALQTAIEALLDTWPVPLDWIRILFGKTAWLNLIQHKYLTGGGVFQRQLVTKAQIAQHIGLSESQIEVSRIQAITSKQGVASTTKSVVFGASKVLIFIAAPGGNQEDPSFGRTFTLDQGGAWKRVYRHVTHDGLGVYNIGEAYWENMIVTSSTGLLRYAASTT